MKLRSFNVLFLFFISIRAIAQEEIPLERVIELAMEKNYDVLVAKNTSEAASINNSYSAGAFLPQINGTASTVKTNSQQVIRVRDRTTNEIVPLKGPTASN